MDKIKAFFKTIFSVNFLLKILLILTILLMLNFIDRGGIRISVWHYGQVGLTNPYSEEFKIRQLNYNVDVPSHVDVPSP